MLEIFNDALIIFRNIKVGGYLFTLKYNLNPKIPFCVDEQKVIFLQWVHLHLDTYWK